MSSKISWRFLHIGWTLTVLGGVTACSPLVPQALMAPYGTDVLGASAKQAETWVFSRPESLSTAERAITGFHASAKVGEVQALASLAAGKTADYLKFQTARFDALKAPYKAAVDTQHATYYGNGQLDLQTVFQSGIPYRPKAVPSAPLIFDFSVHQREVKDNDALRGSCLTPAGAAFFGQGGYVYEVVPLGGAVSLNQALGLQTTSPQEMEYVMGAMVPGWAVKGAVQVKLGVLPRLWKREQGLIGRFKAGTAQRSALQELLVRLRQSAPADDAAFLRQHGYDPADYVPCNPGDVVNVMMKTASGSPLYEAALAFMTHPDELSAVQGTFVDNPQFDPQRVRELMD